MSDSPNLFAKAKVQLVLNNPFFGVLVCHLPTVPMDPNVMMAMGAPPTAMVDGKKIYYNEEWVKTLSDRQRMGLLCHEVLHPALQHLWRRGQRDPELWNKACDYVVNAVIMGTKNTQGTGYELPAEPLYDPKYNGMAVEQVYHLLKEEEQKQKKQGKGKVMDGHMEKEVEGGGKGKGQGKGQGKGKDGSGAGDKGKDKGQGGGKGKGDKGKDKEEGEGGEDGQGEGQGEGEAPNVQQPGEGGEPDYDTDDLDGADGSLEETWKGLLTQAAMVAKSKGSLPGGMERLVDEATRPRVPWQQIIEMYINDVVRDDYDMLRQDRRFLMQGIYFPEMQSNACQVAVAVDTSGSIGQEELKKFVGEISGILRCRGVSKMRLIACDAAVTLDETILPTDPLPEKFGGGGGTDFRPVFKLIQDEPQGLPPALIVYLTDGFGTFPKQDIGIPTIWLMTAHGHMSDDNLPKPEFGIVVRYDLDTEAVSVV